MKRCHFNNWLAKLILAKNYTAITLFFNSFFKYDEEVYEWDNINHECIHQVQQIECFILGLIIGIIVTGLGAPWWDPHARGIVCGLTGASSRATIVRAACESMAYQSYDVLRAMEQDVGLSIERLSVDGGASRNEFIMQFQADLLDIPVLQCETVETTAIGAAYLAGLAVGYWEDLEELEQNAQIVRTFLPHMSAERREQNLAGWRDAVRRSLSTAQ